jgi:6-pyruvoyltetrahydropterin/6-carboxytetrahydropterin synthase
MTTTTRISKSIDISSAHFLYDHTGSESLEKCTKVHGHNFVIEATAEVSRRENAVDIAYGEMKADLYKVVHDKWDHDLINNYPPFDKISPTTENLANYILEELRKLDWGYLYVAVTVYENFPNNKATAEWKEERNE